jgi:hypothetical protein
MTDDEVQVAGAKQSWPRPRTRRSTWPRSARSSSAARR